MQTQFVIAGPVENEEQTWWNNNQGWISDFTEATTLPSDVLTSSLPHGATGIMEVTEEGEVVRFLKTLPHGRGAEKDA